MKWFSSYTMCIIIVATVFLNVACNNQKEETKHQVRMEPLKEEPFIPESESLTPEQRAEIAEQVKEAFIADYRVTKIENGYTLTGNTSTDQRVTTIKDREKIGIGKYHFTRDENGNLVVTIQTIRTASFKVDAVGNLEAVIE